MEPKGSWPYSEVVITCPYPETDQSMPPHPTAWISILILSSHLCLGLPSGLCPWGFPTRTLCIPYVFPICATCHTHFTLLDLKQYRSLSSSCNFLHFPITSLLLGTNILLSTVFSNTLSLHSSINVSDQVSHPYKTTGKIMVLYILICIFLASKLEGKKFCTKW